MFENPRGGRQARNFTTNVPKILDLKSSSEQIFFRKLSLDAPDQSQRGCCIWVSLSYKTVSIVVSSLYYLNNLNSVGNRLNCIALNDAAYFFGGFRFRILGASSGVLVCKLGFGVKGLRSSFWWFSFSILPRRYR